MHHSWILEKKGIGFNAVRDVSFSCESGEVLGLLGPNGAGKTTSLRMLSTALQPTSGEIIINDQDVVADPLIMRKRIGFLSGTTSLYHRLTVREKCAVFWTTSWNGRRSVSKRNRKNFQFA